jgi:ankyrin repeat protein
MIAAGIGWRDLDDVRDRANERDLVHALELCLSLGIDINAANDAGDTALHGAAGKAADGIVKLLIQKGARLDAKNALGRTPRDVALRIRGGKGQRTAALLGPAVKDAIAAEAAARSE